MSKVREIGEREHNHRKYTFYAAIDFMVHKHILGSFFLLFLFCFWHQLKLKVFIPYAFIFFFAFVKLLDAFFLSTYLPFDGSGNPSKVHVTCGVGFPAAEHLTAKILSQIGILIQSLKQVLEYFFFSLYILLYSLLTTDGWAGL